jgi:hypothetical protein
LTGGDPRSATLMPTALTAGASLSTPVVHRLYDVDYDFLSF